MIDVRVNEIGDKLCGKLDYVDGMCYSMQVFYHHTPGSRLTALCMFIKSPSAKKAEATPRYVMYRPILFATVLIIILVGFVIIPREHVIGVSDNNNYSFSVKLTTVIAGGNSWDVPWIWFGFKDERNSYYLLLHSNGVLELSKIVDDVRTVGLGFVNTPLSPFEEHVYEVRVENNKIEVYVDKVLYIVTEDGFSKEGLIKVSSSPNVLFIISAHHIERSH